MSRLVAILVLVACGCEPGGDPMQRFPTQRIIGDRVVELGPLAVGATAVTIDGPRFRGAPFLGQPEAPGEYPYSKFRVVVTAQGVNPAQAWAFSPASPLAITGSFRLAQDDPTGTFGLFPLAFASSALFTSQALVSDAMPALPEVFVGAYGTVINVGPAPLTIRFRVVVLGERDAVTVLPEVQP